MEFRRIMRDIIPCWYELSWREQEPAIVLRVNRDFIEACPVLTGENPIVGHLMKVFKFSNFSGDLRGDFGFNNTLFWGTFDHHGEKEGFEEFVVQIPKVRQKTDQNCSFCEGTGKEVIWENEKRKCFHCGGTGIEYTYNWQTAFAVSASFTIFFRLAAYPEKQTSAAFSQLMTIKTVTQQGKHGGSLDGEFSISLSKWLRSLKEGSLILEMVVAMKTAYRHMLGELAEFENHSFRAYARSRGGLTADCPGDATGIHPHRWDIEENRGYEFSCHNVDSPAQQITLLAGLAALHDRARKEIKP